MRPAQHSVPGSSFVITAKWMPYASRPRAVLWPRSRVEEEAGLHLGG